MKRINLFVIIIIILFDLKITFAQDTIKNDFKSSGKIWGYAFGDYYFKIHADSLGRGNTQYANMPKNSNSFEFRRIYLGYDYNISKNFASSVLLSYEGTTLSDHETRTVIIKAANVRWKNILPNIDIIFGQSSTPSFVHTSEKAWGYRSIEKTLTDMRMITKSNDLGIAIQSKPVLNDNMEMGFHLMIGNGTAQKVELDQFKKLYGGLYAKVFHKKILLDIYSDYERSQLSPYHKSKMTIKGSVAYLSDKITIGVELFRHVQENNVIMTDSYSAHGKDTVNGFSSGISFFIRGIMIKEKLGFFARYDMYDPYTKYNANKYYFHGASPVLESFVTIGLDYFPVKNIYIMPNLWYNMYTNRVKYAYGVSKQDNDMVARITVWYIFNN